MTSPENNKERRDQIVRFGCVRTDVEGNLIGFGPTKVEWSDGAVEFVVQPLKADAS